MEMPTTSEMCGTMAVVECLRAEHNGIMGVYLYLGHDGDNICELKDGESKRIGFGQSGKSMSEAVQRAKADWAAERFWASYPVPMLADATIKRTGTDKTTKVFTTTQFQQTMRAFSTAAAIDASDWTLVNARLAASPWLVRVVGFTDNPQWVVLPEMRHVDE